ncbi:arginase family protein [Bradyrhizobium sp. 26S5]|uniref:arginase family protein n=1 Tax=Bradyrhizobium sp. 26S5 TaxID=3139729 RepID=UPI0030D14F31
MLDPGDLTGTSWEATTFPFDANARNGGPADVTSAWKQVFRGARTFGRERGNLLPHLLEDQVRRQLSGGRRPLTLGGDHSLTWYALKALTSRYGSRITVVHFDAHHDAYPGAELNHYTVMRHVRERLRLRTIGLGYRHDVDEKAASVLDHPIDGLLYLSIDVDYFDPSLVPSVGHSVACTKQAFCDLESFSESLRQISPAQVIGLDIVEWCGSRAGATERQFVSRVVACLASRFSIETSTQP